MQRFKCECCGQWHEGPPSLGADHPMHYFAIPEAERASRCRTTSETCVIDGEAFYVRGCVEIPLKEAEDLISFGVWVSLSRPNFDRFVQLLDVELRSGEEPFFAWLSDPVPTYPPIEHLKSRVHLRNHGIRPNIELEPTEYPLAVEQRQGAPLSRVQKLYAWIEAQGK
jgi:hypothetical protein